MSFFSRIKELFRNMFSKDSVKIATGMNPQISDGMMSVIEMWRDIYGNNPHWIKDPNWDKTTGFAKTVCQDIATKATVEAQITVGNEEADKQLTHMLKDLPEMIEKTVALGATAIRPYYDSVSKTIKLGWYSADCILPVMWNGTELRSAILIDYVRKNEKETFCKMETHSWENEKYIIQSRAFRWDNGIVGSSVPLNSIPEWAGISEEPIVINGLTHPLFTYMKTPITNNIDGSNVGISIFANAVDMLEEIDKTFSSMSWERVAGETKVFVADSMVPQKITEEGVAIDDLSVTDRKMYKKLDAGIESGHQLFEVSAPTLRFNDFKAQLDNAIALACKSMKLDAKSYLVDRQGLPVTAQQILTEKNETYTTVLGLQEKMMKPSLLYVLDNMRILQNLYNIQTMIPENPEDIAISFGDSVMIDETTEKEMAIKEVQNGVRSKLSYLMEYRGLSEEEARKEIAEIGKDQPVMDYFGNGMGV